MKIHVYLLVLTLCVVSVISCSITPSEQSPSSPPLNDAYTGTSGGDCIVPGTGRYLWAFQMFEVDPAELTVEPIPVREVVTHLNVLNFLEKTLCTNCVQIEGMTPDPSGTILVDVRITHPFDDPNFTGFDVRGIVMFDASSTYPVAGLTGPNRTLGDGQLVNADGYTTLFNWTTDGSGPSGMEGYLKGKFATADAPHSLLNGFMRYMSAGAANTRNAFYAGDSLTETFEIDMPDSTFIMGYAVDASWESATTKPVTDPIADFPISANCSEPWMIEIAEDPIGEGLHQFGGSTYLVIDVYDWQGVFTHMAPVIECPGLFNGAVIAEHLVNHSGYSSWGVTLSNNENALPGTYTCLIKVVDKANIASPSWLDLTAYRLYDLTVGEHGWARTWGGIDEDDGKFIESDSENNVYVAGHFNDTVDFDPGPEIVQRTGEYDIYLSKFDENGNFEWVKTWGSSDYEYFDGLALDSSGNIFMAGSFNFTIDFDPDDGVHELTAADYDDNFILKLNSDGSFNWVFSLGTGFYTEFRDIEILPSGNVLVGGLFYETADFDPGPGESEFTSNGDCDAFIALYDQNGNFDWCRAWGGSGYDSVKSVSSGTGAKIYVAGMFSDSVDFNPHPVDTEIRNSVDSWDAYLSKFNEDGDFDWVQTWGDTGVQSASDVVSTLGVVYVAGQFDDMVDMDPGTGTDFHISAGNGDVYLTRFDTDGTWNWTVSYGCASVDWHRDLKIGPGLSAFLCGGFSDIVDFDYGPDTEELTPIGGIDAYLLSYNPDGSFGWVRHWHGTEPSSCIDVLGICFNTDAEICLTGYYDDTADFDPGSGVTEYSSYGMLDCFVMKLLDDGYW